MCSLSEASAPLHRALAGKPPEVQGILLADLVAIWLAGHLVVGDAPATAKLRETLLRAHLRAVRKLLPINAAAIHGSTP